MAAALTTIRKISESGTKVLNEKTYTSHSPRMAAKAALVLVFICNFNTWENRRTKGQIAAYVVTLWA